MKLRTLAALVPIALMAACSTINYNAKTYQVGQVQQQMKVKVGTVVEIREVEIVKKNTNAGTGTGTVVGSVAGSMAGLSSNSTGQGIAGALAGALVGGVVGGVADSVGRTATGLEILYTLDGSPDVLALVQEKGEDTFKVGDRVRLLEGSFASRLVPLGRN